MYLPLFCTGTTLGCWDHILNKLREVEMTVLHLATIVQASRDSRLATFLDKRGSRDDASRCREHGETENGKNALSGEDTENLAQNDMLRKQTEEAKNETV